MKTALITGSARRIGKTIATHLHANGYNVAIHYRNSQQEALMLAEKLNQQRTNSAITLRADLDNCDYHEIIQQVTNHWPQLDLLVNNASLFQTTTIGKATEQDWDALFNANTKATFFLSQAAAPYLKKHSGSIINISDIHGIKPIKDYAIYCMSKAALIMQTQTLAKELAPKIRVNSIAPGMIALPEGDNAISSEQVEKLIARNPLKRMGCAQDIAEAVVFLANSSFITGQTLNIDGGRSLRG